MVEKRREVWLIEHNRRPQSLGYIPELSLVINTGVMPNSELWNTVVHGAVENKIGQKLLLSIISDHEALSNYHSALITEDGKAVEEIVYEDVSLRKTSAIFVDEKGSPTKHEVWEFEAEVSPELIKAWAKALSCLLNKNRTIILIVD